MFKVFNTTISIDPEVCNDVVIVACCLHNLLRDAFLENSGRIFYEYDREKSINMGHLTSSGGYANTDCFYVREQFNIFFIQEGAVSWQVHQISRTFS